MSEEPIESRDVAIVSGGHVLTRPEHDVKAAQEYAKGGFVKDLDAALAPFSGPAEPAAEPSPEPAPAELTEGERAVFEQAGIDHEQAVEFLTANPDAHRFLIPEPKTAEELAHNANLLREIAAGRGASEIVGQLADAISVVQAEDLYDDAVDSIYESEDLQERLALAAQVAAYNPDRLDEFVEEWEAFDPVGPHLFRQQMEQWQAAEWHGQQIARINEEEAARQHETMEAFKSALTTFARELRDPTRLVDLSPDAAALIAGVVEQAPPSSPEEARQLVALARRGTREIGDAREIARLLSGVDELINRQGFRDGKHDDGTPYQPFDRQRAIDAATAEQINLDRLTAHRAPDLLDRGLAAFDAEQERRDAITREMENSPTLRAAHEARQAERHRQARRIA